MKSLIVMGVVFLVGSAAMGDLQSEATPSEVQELRRMVEQLKSEVDQVRAEQATDWLTEKRADEVRGLIQDVLADADTRSSLLQDGTSAGYNKGFFITNADGSYTMKINAQFQLRWEYNTAPGSNPEDDYGFELRRLKLKFGGNVIDKTWKYKFVIASSRNNATGGTANLFIEDAYISKSLGNGLSVKFGQYKVPYLREELVSSSKQLTVDRSIINTRFTWGRSQGIGLGYASDNLTFDFMYNDGPKHINLQSLDGSSNNGLAARAQMLLAGDFKQFKSMSGMPGGEFGAMIGAAFAWTNAGSKDAVLSYPRKDANDQNYGFTVDASLQGGGWNAMAYFVWNNGKAKSSGDWNSSWGLVAQGGIFLADPVEIFARYALGHIEDNSPEDTNWLTVGVNYYPVEDSTNVKVTTDFGWAFDGVDSTYTSSGTGVRSSDDSGEWLLRSQLQLLF